MYLVETVEDVEKLTVKNPDHVAFVTQTTLSVDDAHEIAQALRARFLGIVEPKKSDICYATQHRQDAVKKMASACDVVLVVGSTNRSNSNRLREVAEREGTPAFLLDDPEMVEGRWLEKGNRVGVTAGASAPEELVQHVLDNLRSLGAHTVRSLDALEETISFLLPFELPC